MVLFVIGLILSGVLIYEKFVEVGSSFCTFGGGLDCGVVNKSPYSKIDGFFYLLAVDFGLSIPVSFFPDIPLFSNAMISLIFFIVLIFLQYKYQTGQAIGEISREKLNKLIDGLLIVGVCYGFYLFLVMHFILFTYCIFCILLDVVLISCLVIRKWPRRDFQ